MCHCEQRPMKFETWSRWVRQNSTETDRELVSPPSPAASRTPASAARLHTTIAVITITVIWYRRAEINTIAWVVVHGNTNQTAHGERKDPNSKKIREGTRRYKTASVKHVRNAKSQCFCQKKSICTFCQRQIHINTKKLAPLASHICLRRTSTTRLCLN